MLEQYLSTMALKPYPLLNADMSVVCLVTVIILKIPLFSLLAMKSCSYKSDLQNKIKFHSQLKGTWKVLKSFMVKLLIHHISLENCYSALKL